MNLVVATLAAAAVLFVTFALLSAWLEYHRH
jgi:hypothetical protein